MHLTHYGISQHLQYYNHIILGFILGFQMPKNISISFFHSSFQTKEYCDSFSGNLFKTMLQEPHQNLGVSY